MTFVWIVYHCPKCWNKWGGVPQEILLNQWLDKYAQLSVISCISGLSASLPHTTKGSLLVQPDVTEPFKQIVAQQSFLQQK